MSETKIDRRTFIGATAVVAGAAALSGVATAVAETAVADGQYITQGMSMHGAVDVLTTIADGAIAGVKVLNHNESRNIGEYACQTMPGRIVESQCLDVDTVTGSTITSRAIVSAVEKAIVEAGGDPEAFTGYVAPEPEKTVVEKTVDVAIAGAGPAGLMAAWAAAEQGKTVLICERMGYTGGTTPITGGGIYTQETDIQKYWGTDKIMASHASMQARLDYYTDHLLMPDCPYYNPDMPFIKNILNSSREAVNRLVEIGVGFCPIGKTHVPVFSPGDFQIGGKYSMMIVDNFIRTNYGVEIITEAPVTELTMDGDKVVGFVAQGADGTEYQVKADAVILTTGGYIMNNELYAEYQPDDMKFPRTGPFWADGSGMFLAKDAGAAWCCMDMGVTSHYHAGVSLAEISYFHYAVPGIVVNGNGDRFVNESLSYIVALRSFKEEPTTDFYWIFDDAASYGLYPNGNSFGVDYTFLKQTGDIISGDNYADLAEKANLPGLVAALDAVNDCALNGTEDAFGNAALKPLNTAGKMHACKLIPTPYIAQGGVMIDLDGRVQREDGSVIEGLYAAGDVTGALENRDGANYMIGLTQAFAYGLIAGKTVAADLA